MQIAKLLSTAIIAVCNQSSLPQLAPEPSRGLKEHDRVILVVRLRVGRSLRPSDPLVAVGFHALAEELPDCIPTNKSRRQREALSCIALALKPRELYVLLSRAVLGPCHCGAAGRQASREYQSCEAETAPALSQNCPGL